MHARGDGAALHDPGTTGRGEDLSRKGGDWAKMSTMRSTIAKFSALAIALSVALCVGACAHVKEAEVKGTPGSTSGQEEAGVKGTPGLTADRVGRLFDCFTLLQRKSPESVYWVSPLQEAEGYFVTTQFHHSPSRMYSGHEIVIFGKDRAAYYWMPGALPDATGFVANGVYRVDAELPDHSKTVRLRLEKRHPTAFVLLQDGLDGAVQRISPRPLDPVVTREELHDLAYYSLIFHAQALQLDGARSQVATRLADRTVIAACRNITPMLDTVAGYIEDKLAAGGTQDTR